MTSERYVDIITMGCSKNLVDSEKLLYHLHKKGFHVYHNARRIHHDIAIVNTCGFINDAKEESVNLILELSRMRQSGRLKRLYVMGCLSERFFNELNKEIPEVDRYFGKFNWVSLLNELGCEAEKEEGRVITTPSHYAYLKIAEGCNRRCAYCAIPLITGAHKSRPMEEILSEVQSLVQLGVKEFQVVSQELTYYGLDIYGHRKLAELVSRMSDITGVEWIRLHYGYPNNFPYDLSPVIRERENVCKYLDIALQHSSNKVLELMHRNTTREYQEEMIHRTREEVPGICLRTTFMVGFPGEEEEDFDDLMDFTAKMRFERMGAFAYSEEEGTFAACHYKDEVAEDVKGQRLSRLMALQQSISEDVCRSRVGSVMRTIIDRREGDYYIGRTQYDSPEADGEVLIPVEGRRLLKGHFYDVFITDADEFDLKGVLHKN